LLLGWLAFPILRRRDWGYFVVAPGEMVMEIPERLARHEQEDGGPARVRKSKEQANRADLFFGWNRVDKTH
jgi:hypothetical protein